MCSAYRPVNLPPTGNCDRQKKVRSIANDMPTKVKVGLVCSPTGVTVSAGQREQHVLERKLRVQFPGRGGRG
jgi:hypothetical protein